MLGLKVYATAARLCRRYEEGVICLCGLEGPLLTKNECSSKGTGEEPTTLSALFPLWVFFIFLLEPLAVSLTENFFWTFQRLRLFHATYICRAEIRDDTYQTI